jgi:large subunit ribosomal protein L10
LSVAEITELRRGMREVGARFRVTKNRLAKIALADTPYSPLANLFTGPTGIAFSADPVAAPKAAVGYAKRNEKLAIIGGALAGSLLTPEQVRALADLPSIDELRAKLVGLITTPAARLVGILQAPGGQLARVLAAYAERD